MVSLQSGAHAAGCIRVLITAAIFVSPSGGHPCVILRCLVPRLRSDVRLVRGSIVEALMRPVGIVELEVARKRGGHLPGNLLSLYVNSLLLQSTTLDNSSRRRACGPSHARNARRGGAPLDVEKGIDVLPARRGVHGSTLGKRRPAVGSGAPIVARAIPWYPSNRVLMPRAASAC